MEPYLPFLFWGIILAISVIVEIASQQLISIWFAAGALVSFVAACFGASPQLQLVLFVLVSLLLLLCTRPLVRKIFSFDVKNTNTQEVGRIATVIQPIDHAKGTGRVRLDGVDWIAVSQTGVPISLNTSVRVEAVDGTKLLVSVLPETVQTTAN